MPVYVYRNLVTNETFEFQQRITEDALTVDPRTGDPVRRVIQPVGIAFKGSGFYVNDSRSGTSQAASASAERAKSGESAGEAGNGAANKPASADTAKDGAKAAAAPASTSSTPSTGNEKKSSSAPSPL